jgi:streptomycin 3"-adenylyltransferase
VRQLDEVVRQVREVLGSDLLGVYLFGSAVVGGLRPRSDLDVLAVTARPLDAPEKEALIRGLLPLSADGQPTPSKRWLEVTVVARPAVRPWRFPPPIELQYGEWWRDEFEAGEMSPWQDPNPDLAIMLAMALRASRTLHGPPLVDVLDRIPMPDVVRATTETLDGLLEDLDSDTRNVVLTLVRAWATVADGALLSKGAAASWAMARLPPEHRPVLGRALSVYLEGGEDRWDELGPRIRPFADHVAAEIRAATAEGRPRAGP